MNFNVDAMAVIEKLSQQVGQLSKENAILAAHIENLEQGSKANDMATGELTGTPEDSGQSDVAG